MKLLYVLRHAKAEREAPSGGDFDRPLAERGRNDAARLGKTFKTSAMILPDAILASSAKRTRETAERLSAQWPKPPSIRTDDTLYLAPAARLMDAVRALPDTAQSAMIVGHNPGMEEFAALLANKVPSPAFYRMRDNFATCALASFEISVESWAEFDPARARLISFSTPNDLADNADA